MIGKAAKTLKANENPDGGQSQALYFMAYELLPEDPTKKAVLYENPAFWKFKPNVNFETMLTEIKNSTRPEDYPVLKKFIEIVSQLENRLIQAFKINNLKPIICPFKKYFRSLKNT